MTIANIFVCLVHESQECIIDLVHNLRCCDPRSDILLYNGGTDDRLLSGFPFDRYGVSIHPDPRPAQWGRLHTAVFACMEYCLQTYTFDTLTIVDSDQLLLREGYSDFLANSGLVGGKVGMLCSDLEAHGHNRFTGPCKAAYDEMTLWKPFLQAFPDGERQFPHWSFWPSSVFMRQAVRHLIEVFNHNRELGTILKLTKLWATEEVLFPTLTAVLGYDLANSPVSQDYVRYGAVYEEGDVDCALADDSQFWIHPVRRDYSDPLRTRIRRLTNQYGGERDFCKHAMLDRHGLPVEPFELISGIEGWLTSEEAVQLATACRMSLNAMGPPWEFIEVGSYHGRSTVVLATVLRSSNLGIKLYAIDPHLGTVGSLDSRLYSGQPTGDKLTANLQALNLRDVVTIVPHMASEIRWTLPIGFLFIDGLHDYPNVSKDFFKFDHYIVPGGFVVFHDYAPAYPGVITFVNEVLANGSYQFVSRVDSLVVCKKM